MSKVSLRAYNREIEGLIEHGQRLDEAVSHCRHILETYPKHLETYRLLGKAYLEAKRYEQAVDIFQRVLVSAPEDFVSHVGMSIIADDQGKLDEAIWHMERAFEVQPSNAAIQGELQRLFGRRDGVEPPRIRLTRGALARMYVQGELYNQAISEIQAVLGYDSKRTDMQVLLALAYFHNGQKTEALEACADLLARFPYCLDANRLMVEILPGTQRAESAQGYRERVIELDPYAAFTQGSVFHTETVADSAVSLERLDYVGAAAEAGGVLGIGLAASPAATGRPTGEPSWLTGSRADEESPNYPPQANGDLPDFMRDAGWVPSPLGADASPPIAPESDFVQAAVPGDLPAWVQALAPADESEGQGELPVVPQEDSMAPADQGAARSVDSASTSGQLPGSELPDWLARLSGHELDEPAATKVELTGSTEEVGEIEAPGVSAREPSPEAAPDWLKDFDTDLESPVHDLSSGRRYPESASAAPPSAVQLGALGTTAQEQDDAMAWLEGLAAKHGAKPEELVTDPKARLETPPRWIDAAGKMGDQAVTAGAIPGSAPGAPSAAEPPPASAAGEKAFDWLGTLSDRDAFAGMAAENEGEETPIIEEGQVPDWSQATRPVPVGEEPSWLSRELTPDRQPKSDKEPDVPPQSETGGSLPEWLAGLDKEPSSAPNAPASSEGLPDWLLPEAESEPQVAAPTRPADWRPVEPKVDSKLQKPESTVPTTAATVPSSTPYSAAGLVPEARAPTLAPVAARSRGALSISQPGAASLATAQSELGRGNIAAALDIYGKLIRKGKSLEDIIRDLRDALYRYPVEVPIWQALGDAYMRANRLQEALDAYTKAEELLR